MNEALANTIALNTGAGLYVYGSAASIEEGFKIAREAIQQGKAIKVLDDWAKESKSLAGEN